MKGIFKMQNNSSPKFSSIIRMLGGRNGQSILEYLILTSLIAIGSIGVIQVLSGNLKKKLATVSEAIKGGTPKKFVGESVKNEDIKTNTDLGDFSDAIRPNEKN
jgi:Flp pilus assembly pilin Flp